MWRNVFWAEFNTLLPVPWVHVPHGRHMGNINGEWKKGPERDISIKQPLCLPPVRLAAEMQAPQWNWMIIYYVWFCNFVFTSTTFQLSRITRRAVQFHLLWHIPWLGCCIFLSHFAFASLRRLVARFPCIVASLLGSINGFAPHSMLAVHIAFARAKRKRKRAHFSRYTSIVVWRDTAQPAMYITTAGVQFNDSVFNDIT